MRKLIVSIAAAASALAVATPAAAQYYPAPPAYGYGYQAPPAYGYGYPAPQGYAYGYQNAYGVARALQARLDNLQRHIRHLDRRNMITSREARNLRAESRAIERRLRETARYGLQPRERRAVEIRIARLEQKIVRDMRDGRRGWRAYGDRDRDGRLDRYEDDRGRYPG